MQNHKTVDVVVDGDIYGRHEEGNSQLPHIRVVESFKDDWKHVYLGDKQVLRVHAVKRAN